MQEDRANYGRPREPGDELESGMGGYGSGYNEDRARAGYSPVHGSGTSLSSSDERSWSILSHLSVLVWPVTGLLPVAPLVIWLVYKNRSPRVGFQALQSFWYQAAWAIALTVGWAMTGLLTVILIGFLLMPFMALASLIPFAHGAYAAYRVDRGVEYRYPVIANMLDGGRDAR